MIYLVMLLALGLGYVIGLMQKGIVINVNKDLTSVEEDLPQNDSYGIPSVKEYYDDTKGANNF